jgi:hypothetical protein
MGLRPSSGAAPSLTKAAKSLDEIKWKLPPSQLDRSSQLEIHSASDRNLSYSSYRKLTLLFPNVIHNIVYRYALHPSSP